MQKNEDNELLNSINKLHTTELGAVRICRNLSIDDNDVVEWCRARIINDSLSIIRRGKNWYVETDDCVITINAYSFTVITAHKKDKRK